MGGEGVRVYAGYGRDAAATIWVDMFGLLSCLMDLVLQTGASLDAEKIGRAAKPTTGRLAKPWCRIQSE